MIKDRADRHQRLKELFNGAADLPEGDREAFLRRIESDETLVQECLELLRHDGESTTYAPLNTPTRSDDHAHPVERLQPGDVIGGYEVLEEIGAGGIGVVYRAYDPKLDRNVALKTLDSEFACQPEWLERFRREARALAALNHSNVVTVHAVEDAETPAGNRLPFLVMELVEGKTLDQLLKAGAMTVDRFERFARDLLSGVAAAHARGITHRDLKPSNIIVKPTGTVKVIDFGLAKSAVPFHPGLANDLSSRTRQDAEEASQLTQAGTVLGTASYMSPEQVAAQETDARSDVFALGSVLYEAATGRRAFEGPTVIETLHSILHTEPQPIAAVRPDFPSSQASVLHQAMSKRPQDRFENAGAMHVALEAAASSSPGIGASAVEGKSPGSVSSTPNTTSNVENRKGSSALSWAIATAALLVLATVGIWSLGSRLSSAASDSSRAINTTSSPRPMSMKALTDSGIVISAALSPDGERFSFVESEDGLQSMHIRRTDGGPSLELLPAAEVFYWGQTFSKDGTEILYGVKGDELPAGGAFKRISSLGGASTPIVDDLDSVPTVSPDGRSIAWVRGPWGNRPGGLMTADIASGTTRVVAAAESPYSYTPTFFGGPSFSPNGQQLAVAQIDTKARQGRLVVLDQQTGELQWTRKHPSWRNVGHVAWLCDGSGLLLIAGEGYRTSQVWLVPYPEGDAHRLTNDLNDYRLISLNADCTSFVTVFTTISSSVWGQPDGNSGSLRKLSRSNLAGSLGVAVLPDKRLVYTAGNSLIVSDAEGSKRSILVQDEGLVALPAGATSEQGRIRYLTTPDSGGFGVSVRSIKADGSGRRELLTLPKSADHRRIALKGNSVYYSSSGPSAIFHVSLDGGVSKQLVGQGAFLPAVSPDGSRLAYLEFAPWETGSNERYLVVRSLTERGASIDPQVPEIRIPGMAPTWAASFLFFSPDGESLLANTMTGDRSNVWRIPLDGSPPVAITQFDDQRMMWVANAGEDLDIGNLVFARGSLNRDALLIRDFN